MPELYLFGLKFLLLALIYGVLALVIRALVRDLPMPGVASAPPVADAGPPAEPGSLWVEPLAGGQAVAVQGEVLLGRGPDCHIRLSDPFASAAHARLTPRGEGVLLEDLESTNGTFKGTQPVQGPVVLLEGDTFSIGDVTFRMTRR